MIKKSELGKLKMPPMKKKPAEQEDPEMDFAVEEDQEEPDMEAEEGDPEEEAMESPEEEAAEDEGVEAKLADISDEELQAELARRKKAKFS